ncbi:type II toxin-antitoxin system Phd/YefM family antitoxin [Aurantimicrobium minutum]|uniref:type II toxin-antitoxin system Phd/YefM family antitoxin n=1 Tax=Aurantimicrobium minutum TaxID=708131 RepID=UPI00247306F7|nr:type II toxin-antitoxin system prevent-host-death family antitoxin [Aurantimicrobium minutum]MDH6535953.1 prevent-host-death family protein [Aurantimicrobium minutum]
MQQVNILEARNSLSRLVSFAVQGEEIVIANRGKAVVRLVPIEPAPVKSGKAAAMWLLKNPPPTPTSRTKQELETQIQENREAWD